MKAQETLEISLNGNLGLTEIEGAYSDVKKAIDEEKKIKLIVTKVNHIDVSFVQLFMVLLKNYKSKSDIEIHLNSDQNEYLNKMGVDLKDLIVIN